MCTRGFLSRGRRRNCGRGLSELGFVVVIVIVGVVVGVVVGVIGLDCGVVSVFAVRVQAEIEIESYFDLEVAEVEKETEKEAKDGQQEIVETWNGGVQRKEAIMMIATESEAGLNLPKASREDDLEWFSTEFNLYFAHGL